jgi:hypothetical protein
LQSSSLVYVLEIKTDCDEDFMKWKFSVSVVDVVTQLLAAFGSLIFGCLIQTARLTGSEALSTRWRFGGHS